MHPPEKVQQLLRQLNTVIVGKSAQIQDCVACLLAGGHLLIEDVPGVGKTTLAHALARSFGLHFSRVQFTSDLMPSDLIGVSVFERAKDAFVFHQGPVFAQVLLAMKLPSIYPAIDHHIAGDDSVVVQLVSTAESILNRRLDELEPAEREALDLGADDYMVKPFAVDELLARLRALFRRHRMESAPDVYRYEDLELNPRSRQVFRSGKPIDLTAKEFDLLELFMRHAGQVLTREMIYEHIWDYDFGGESNIIEVYVRYLRTKLEAHGGSRLIQTIRGVGYTLREN